MPAKSYHSANPAKDHSRIQESFCANKIRLEIGRAARDGRSSYCHPFLDDETYFKLRTLMFCDGVDQYAVDKFICQVFSGEKNSLGKICSLVKESASCKFDMKEEGNHGPNSLLVASCKLQAQLILPHVGQKLTLGKVHKNRLPRCDGNSKGRTD